MQALELDSPELAKAVARELLQEGIIINRTHETVLRFLPPYVIQKKHVDQLIKALDAALQQAALPKDKDKNNDEKFVDKNSEGKKKTVRSQRKEIARHAHA